VLGNARAFCDTVLKKFRTSSRMQAWTLLQKAYAISAFCDDVTRDEIEQAITADNFDCGNGGNGVVSTEVVPPPGANRRFTPLGVHPGGDPVLEGTLTEFIKYFLRRFSRVEAVEEARAQVERTLGQTQDLKLF